MVGERKWKRFGEKASTEKFRKPREMKEEENGLEEIEKMIHEIKKNPKMCIKTIDRIRINIPSKLLFIISFVK